MERSTSVVVFGLVAASLLVVGGACSSESTNAPPGGTTSSSGSSGETPDAGDGSTTGDRSAPDPSQCTLGEVTGAAKVNATFAVYDPPTTVPTATTGGALAGTYRVTKAKVFLPSATKGLADPAKSTGTVTGWAVFEGTRYRIKLTSALTINSVLGDRPQNISVDSQGGFTVTGATLAVDQKCDPPDAASTATYTFTAAGDTATLVVKTPVDTFGDAYLEIEASKK